MKYAACGLLAAFLALGVYGAIPTTVEGWYRPENGFKTKESEGQLFWYDKDGAPHWGNVKADETGELTSVDVKNFPQEPIEGDPEYYEKKTAYDAFYAGLETMLEILKTETIAKQNTERIEEIGNNLNNLMSINGININNSTKGESYTIKFSGGSLANTLNSHQTDIPATSDEEDPTDWKSLNWTDNSASGKMQINGWSTASPGAGVTVAEVLTNGTGYVNDPARSWSLVARTMSGDLKYMPFGRLAEVEVAEPPAPDDASVTTNSTHGATADGVISLYGWNGEAEENAETLTQMLSDGSSAGRGTHYVLARVGTGDDAALGYVPIGEGLDGVTWATNWTESIKGIASSEAEKVVNWNTNWIHLADSIASSQEAMREYVDNTLNWTTNWYASTEQLNMSVGDIRDYINGQLDIITNALTGINSVVDSQVGGITSVREYVQEVMNLQTNFITNAQFARLNGTVTDTRNLVDYYFDILTNQIVGIRGAVESQVGDIKTVSDYVKEVVNIQTNFITDAQFAKLNGTVRNTRDLVDYYFDILTNQIVGIRGVIESGDVETVNTVSDYIREVVNLQTNFITNAEFARLNGTVENTKELVDYYFDILTNQIVGINNVIESDRTDIKTASEYIQEVISLQTNFVTNVELAKLNDSVESTADFVNSTFDILTNEIAGIKGVIESGDIEAIDSVKAYVQEVMNVQTNEMISIMEAMNNGTASSARELINYQYDILTNQIAGILGVVESGDFETVQTVRDYIKTEMGVQTNELIAIITALDNGVAEDVKKLIDYKYDILTNEIAGIMGVIESGDFDTVTSVKQYVQAELGIQTNEMMAVIKALDNDVADSVKELVDYRYDLLTNQIVGIKNVVNSDRIDIDTVAEYVQEVVNVQTNFITNAELARINGSVKDTADFVNSAFDILTNEIVGIKGVIESGRFATIDTVGEYVRRVVNVQTNVIMIENWNYVTNFIVRYLGGMYDPEGSGSGGGDDAVPTIEPEDDPYSEEYEPQKVDDYLLPVKNARMLVAITNEPLSRIEAGNLLDFASVDTNKGWRVQIRGFDDAKAGEIPIKRSGDEPDEYRIEWAEFPEGVFAITTNRLSEITNWMRQNNVTNIFTTVVSNAEAVATMSTNIFAHVKAETMLDNESVWTNGARRVEIKGYKNALPYRVPFTDVTQDSMEAGKDKELVWEQLPFADSEAYRFGVANPTRTIEAVQRESADTETTTYKALTLYGFNIALNGTAPVKDGDGIVWTDLTPKYDDTTITTNQNSQLVIKGFDSAANNTMPMKNASGDFVWGSAGGYTAGAGIQFTGGSTNVIAHNFIAGAGISLTPASSGTAVTIASATPTSGTVVDPHAQEITFLTELWYDATTHQIKAKRMTAKVMFVGTVPTEEEFVAVQCTPHSAEHEAEGSDN